MKSWILWEAGLSVCGSVFSLIRWSITDKTVSDRILSSIILVLSVLWSVYGALLALGVLK